MKEEKYVPDTRDGDQAVCITAYQFNNLFLKRSTNKSQHETWILTLPVQVQT